jgi:hypothetical protein
MLTTIPSTPQRFREGRKPLTGSSLQHYSSKQNDENKKERRHGNVLTQLNSHKMRESIYSMCIQSVL